MVLRNIFLKINYSKPDFHPESRLCEIGEGR